MAPDKRASVEFQAMSENLKSILFWVVIVIWLAAGFWFGLDPAGSWFGT